MPELPEVETIRRGLERELRDRGVSAVERRPGRLRGGNGPRPFSDLEGQAFTKLRRHGKFLLCDLERSTLVVHLGMTGKLLFAAPGDAERPHTHLVIELDDGRLLRFSDPRRFGLLKVFRSGGAIPDLAHYGTDALDPAFTPASLERLLDASASPLKAFLLDQRKVAGVGNIYACEALWRAGLSPRRKARNTPQAKVGLLHESIRGALDDSLAAGGSSFNDYVDAIGQEGRFMMQVAVFQREDEPCPRCAAPVRRIVQAGRSTFYCAACQK